MVWLRDTLVFPHASTACQVTVSVYVPAQLPAVGLSLSCTTVALLHASLAVGAVKVGEAGHSTVPLEPAGPIVGGWSSTTIIVWLRDTLVLPHASTACQVTVSV